MRPHDRYDGKVMNHIGTFGGLSERNLPWVKACAFKSKSSVPLGSHGKCCVSKPLTFSPKSGLSEPSAFLNRTKALSGSLSPGTGRTSLRPNLGDCSSHDVRPREGGLLRRLL